MANPLPKRRKGERPVPFSQKNVNKKLKLLWLTEVQFSSVEWWSLLLPVSGAAFLCLLLGGAAWHPPSFGRAAFLSLLEKTEAKGRRGESTTTQRKRKPSSTTQQKKGAKHQYMYIYIYIYIYSNSHSLNDIFTCAGGSHHGVRWAYGTLFSCLGLKGAVTTRQDQSGSVDVQH